MNRNLIPLSGLSPSSVLCQFAGHNALFVDRAINRVNDAWCRTTLVALPFNKGYKSQLQ